MSALRLLPRGRRAVLLVAVPVAVALVAALAVARLSGPDTYRVRADFAEAPGIYAGNAVKILGVRVGHVAAVDTRADGVRLALQIDDRYRVPRDAVAYLMAPNAVNDRFIELTPAYPGTGGRLEDGGSIPRERTVLPASVDQIIDSLDEFSTALGPEGANADGSLSEALAAVSQVLGGQGSTIHELVGSLGRTFAAVSDDTDALSDGLSDLGDLTHAASGVSSAYRRLARNLADVSGTIADDAPQVAAIMSDLQGVLRELRDFVRRNRTQLAGTVQDLSRVAGEVGRQQGALGRLLAGAPLAVSNVGNTVADGPGGPVVRGRLDPVRGATVGREICADGLLRLMLVALEKDPAKRDVVDLACGLDRWLDEELPKPQGAPDASAWTRRALAGLGG